MNDKDWQEMPEMQLQRATLTAAPGAGSASIFRTSASIWEHTADLKPKEDWVLMDNMTTADHSRCASPPMMKAVAAV